MQLGMKGVIGILAILFLCQGFADEVRGSGGLDPNSKKSGVGAINNTGKSNASSIPRRGTLLTSVNVKDFGAVGDGVADDTVAINAALASGAREIKFGGTFKYIGQLVIPSGVTLIGESAAYSTLLITNAGYAVAFSGSGGKIQYMSIKCSRDGVDFSTRDKLSTLNTIEHSRIIGSGRGASSAVVGTPAQTTGVNFNQARGGGAWAAYYNLLLSNYIRGFDVAVLFEAPAGNPAKGGNANRAIENQIADYWVAYDIMSIENEVFGGFFNNSLGNSVTDYGIAYRLRNGAHFNKIHPAAGEPGIHNVRMYQEAGTFGNYILSAPSNFSLGDKLLGGESVMPREVSPVVAYGLAGNAYYIQQISLALTSAYTSELVTVEWAAKVARAAAVSAGSAIIKLSLAGGVINAEWLNVVQARTGSSVMLAGIYVDSANAVHLVWHVHANSTEASSGELNAKVSVVGTSGVRRQVDMTMTNVGTKNPSTYAVPIYEAAHNIGTVAAGEAKVFSVTVPSTALGDLAVATYSTSIAGLMMTASVTAANRVELVVFNPTSASITPIGGILRVETRRGSGN